MPWGNGARAGAGPTPPTVSPPPSDADDRHQPGRRWFRVTHEACCHYPAVPPLDRVIHEEMESPAGEDLAIWDQGRIAAAILLSDDGASPVQFDYPEPVVPGDTYYGDHLVWECPARIEFTVATSDHELFRGSCLGLTLERVIAEQMEDVRRGRAWCAAHGQEPPAEDRTIWEEGRLVAAIVSRDEGPVIVRFDGASMEGGAL